MKKNSPRNDIKICAVICEYNPFHNGHLYQLKQIKAQSGCDGILCLMSGSFTQRGEAALSDKFTRARLAIEGGADIVLELPLPFSVGNAEVFARGAVKMLAAMPFVTTLAFGCEWGGAEDFVRLAAALSEESPSFRLALQTELKTGASFAAARAAAIKKVFPETDGRLYSSPNCVLGLEYAKAVLREKADISLLPLLRKGCGHGENILQKNYSSASSIRAAVLRGEDISAAVPSFTNEALPLFLTEADYKKLDSMEYFALTEHSSKEIAALPDCSEGLENGLKAALQRAFTAEDVIKEVTSRRYTSARIRRILLAGALGITSDFQRACLNAPLYFRPLAVKEEKADVILSLLQKQGGMPVITRKGDEELLSRQAKELFCLTVKADTIYASLCRRSAKRFYTAFVK